MKKILFIITALLITFSFSLDVNAFAGFELTDEVVQVNDGTPYQIQYTGDITGLKFTISNTSKPSGTSFEDPVATVTNTGLVTVLKDGVVGVSVSCVDSEDGNCMSYIQKIKNSLTILVNKSNKYSESFTAIMTQFNQKKLEANTEMNKITTTNVNANFIRFLMTYSFDVTDDITNEVNGRFENFGQEFISLQFPDFHSQVTDLNLISNIVEDSLELTGMQNPFPFNVVRNEGLEEETTPSFFAYITGPKTNKKVVTFSYPAGNDADKTAVMNFAVTLPVNNKSYINLATGGNDSLDDIINIQYTGSDMEKYINDNDIDAYVDFRRGVGGIDPFAAGHIVLGKNGVYYTAQEFKIWSTLRLPKNPDKDIKERIKTYFETYLDDIDEIVVEEVEGLTNIYRVHITEKDELTFLDRIMNFFVPNVYAAPDDTVVTFAVEEVAEEIKTANPQTSVPGLLIYTSLAIASAVGLGLTLKKKKTNN